MDVLIGANKIIKVLVAFLEVSLVNLYQKKNCGSK